MSVRRRSAGLLALAGATLLCACAPEVGGGRAADKVGGDPERLSLTVADSQPIGAPSNIGAEMFADEVTVRSNGAISVNVVADASSAGATDDRPIIAAVRDGTYDLAMVPTRAWVDAGVESMAPLQAPFEVVSNAHMVAVAQDPAIGTSVLGPLDAIGVHGLALFPEALRMLFSFRTQPVRSPSDLRGTVMWSITPHIDELLAPLQVRVVRDGDGDIGAMVLDGRIDVGELDFTRATVSDLFTGAVTTAGLPLTAKFLSLVVNADVWSSLTEAQRSTLGQAAEAAREGVAAGLPQPDAQAAAFCARGGAVVAADYSELSAFRSAVAPVVDDLAAQSSVVSRIRALRPAVTSDHVTACDQRPAATSGLTGDSSADPAPVDTAGFPDGVYRMEWTTAFAEQWNTDHDASHAILLSEPDLRDLPAVVTWTMADGHYRFEIEFRNREPLVVDGGTYRIDGDHLFLTLPPNVGNTTNELRWSVNRDGTVTMAQLDDHPLDPYYGVAWERIGDAPPSGP